MGWDGAEVVQGWTETYQEGVHAAIWIAEPLENDRPVVSDYPATRALVLADRGRCEE